MELLVTQPLVDQSYEVLINNYYKTSVYISGHENKSKSRSLFEVERNMEDRELLDTEGEETPSVESTTNPSGTTSPPTNPPTTLPPQSIPLSEFYRMMKDGGELTRDYVVDLIRKDDFDKLRNDTLESVEINGNGHKISFSFFAADGINTFQLFESVDNVKLTNIKFEFSAYDLIINGLFGDVSNSVFYNIEVCVSGTSMKVELTGDNRYKGILANEVTFTSLLHIGIDITSPMSITINPDPYLGSIETYFGMVVGKLSGESDDSKVGAGGLYFKVINDIIIENTEVNYRDVFCGGLIGYSSSSLGDSGVYIENLSIGTVKFGGLIGECNKCQVSRSFVEIKTLEIKKISYFGGLISIVSRGTSGDYSSLSHSYFQLNTQYTTDNVDDDQKYIGGIAATTYNDISLNNLLVRAVFPPSSENGDGETPTTSADTPTPTKTAFIIANNNGALVLTNVLISGSGSFPLVPNTLISFKHYNIYTAGVTINDPPQTVSPFPRDADVSDYITNITFTDNYFGIEGFTERSEMKFKKPESVMENVDFIYQPNNWDFYCSYPADLMNPIDINGLSESSLKYTMKILPKRMRYQNIRIFQDNNVIYDQSIFENGINRIVVITLPSSTSTPEGVININNGTELLFTIVYYDSTKMEDVFNSGAIGAPIYIEANNFALLSLLQNNYMRVRVNCSNNVVKYSGSNIISGSEEFNFTYEYNATAADTFDVSETCVLVFVGTNLDPYNINLQFHVTNEIVEPSDGNITMYHTYTNNITKTEIDLFTSITTIPLSSVCFFFYCPSGLICNATSFCLEDPNDIVVIHISQQSVSDEILNFILSFNITSEDPAYGMFSPYLYEFSLNSGMSTPNYILNPSHLEFNSFKPVNSSYSISTTTVPSGDIKISVDLSKCNNNYEVNPMTFTLNGNNKIGVFNVTPINTKLLNSDFRCNITNNLETSAFEYKVKERSLNVSVLTIFEDLTEAPKLISVNESEDENSIILYFDVNCYGNTNDLMKLFENDTNCNGKFISNINPSFEYHTCLWMDRKSLKIYYELINNIPDATTITLKEYTLRATNTSELYSSGSRIIAVRAKTPEMESAKFDDGYTITIKFDNEIGYGLNDGDLCNEIFNSSKSLGSSICSFGEDKRTMKMTLSADAEVVPNDIIIPYPNRLKGSIKSLDYAKRSATLETPDSIPNVTAIIEQEKTITTCQALILDGSSSTGGGSRSLIFEWENASYVNENIIEYLNSNSGILAFGEGEITENITLELTVTNFFNQSDTKEINITVTDTSILESSIEGSKSVTLRSDKDLYIKGHGSLINCGETIESSTINSNFSMLNENDEEMSISNFTTIDPSRLYIGVHSLSIGKYKVRYTVSMDGLSSAVSEIELNVVLGDFSLRIDGDPIRSLPQSKDFKLGVIAEDLDNINTVFIYSWTCKNKNDQNCDSSIINRDTKEISITGNSLEAGLYNFSAIVTTNDVSSPRKMEVYILVTITVDSLKLSFSIENLFSNSTIYKPSDTIGLKAKIEENSHEDLKYLWIYLSDNSVNPLKSRNDSSLVYISCEKLNPKISNHIIRFYIYKGDYDSKNKLFSDYTFSVIEPPKGGIISSSKTDISLGESILLSTSNWLGAKEFSYRFGVLINENLQYLQPMYSSSNSYNGLLPLGDKQNNYELKVIVFVKDVYGGVSNSSIGSNGKTMIINSHPITELEKVENITKKLEENNNFDQIFNLVNGIKDQITNDLSENSICIHGNKSEKDNSTCNCFSGYTGTLCEKHIPIDGGLSVNYTESKPDRECGKVTYYRWKECNNPKPQYGGKECEIIKEEIIEIKPCENSINRDGNWSEWGDWSECSAKCKIYNGREVEGIRSRSRLCNNPIPYNEGKDCEGNSTETMRCFNPCTAPLKLCPGQYINDSGIAVGKECNGNGKCIRNRVCKEFEPNCHSSCECFDGFSGSSCQYTETEYENNKKIKSQLINSIETAISKTILTSDSMEQQSSTILNVINPPEDIQEDSLSITYKIIDNTITQLKNNKPLEISYNSINDYVKATSLLLKNEWSSNNKKSYDNRNKRELEEEKSTYKIGSQLMNLYKNISAVHYNQQYSAPLEISTDSLGISLIKADLSFDPNSTISVNQADVDLSSVINTTETTEIAIFDFVDNPNKNDSVKTNRTSGLVSISLSNENGEKTVENLESPIYYRQRLNDDTELKHIRCSYYDGENLRFNGVILVGIIKVENGSNYALCSMFHLTDFTVQKKSIFPKMNFVNPIGDAKLLGNYDSSNMLVPIILGSVLVLCIFFWIYTKCRDKNEDKIVSEEKARNFLLYGKLRPSKKDKKDEEEKNNSLRKHFFKYYYERLLDEHKLLAPGFQSVDELMEINRSQNVLCLTATILTDTAVNALFFGSNPANISQLVTTSIISALVMLPVTVIIPFFFKFANSYKSHTLKSYSKNKPSKLQILKNKIKLIKKQMLNQNRTLLKYQSFLLIESGIFVLLELIFTIISLIVLPSGYVTVVIVGLLVIYILEAFTIFVVTTLKQPFYFMYMFVIDLLLMLFNFTILVFYLIIIGHNDNVVYEMWKFFYDISTTQEVYCYYIEDSLNCCGWNNIHDYNVSDCSSLTAYVSGNQNSCKEIYYEKFDKYSALWIIYFLIGIIVFIPKLVLLVKYVLYQFNEFERVLAEEETKDKLQIEKDKLEKEKEKNISEEEKMKRKAASEMLVRSCKKLLFKRRFIREREYVIWLRNRKIRAIMIMFANFIVCLYILIMIYINLLYGVKFESSQANQWIISSVVSMAIDVILQEPSMILLKTVASTTLSSIIPF